MDKIPSKNKKKTYFFQISAVRTGVCARMDATLVDITSSSLFKFIKKNWENTKYDVPLLAVSYSYSRRAVAWH